MARLTHESRRVQGLLEACFDSESRAACRAKSPLELRGPFVTAGSQGFAAAAANGYYLRNVTAGVFGGDRLEVSLRALPGASVQVTSPSATRVFTASERASLVTHIEAGPSSVLVWGPHATILQAGASLSQRTTMRIEEGSSLISAEVLCFGRQAHGEGLCFSRYESEYKVLRSDDQLSYEERYVLLPGEALDAALGQFRVLATIYFLGKAASVDIEVPRGVFRDCYAGSSTLPNGAGIAVRALTSSLSEGQRFCDSVIANASRPRF